MAVSDSDHDSLIAINRFVLRPFVQIDDARLQLYRGGPHLVQVEIAPQAFDQVEVVLLQLLDFTLALKHFLL